MGRPEAEHFDPRPDVRGLALRVAPGPTPLVGPALSLMLGIWLSDSLGPVPGTWRTAVLAVPAVALILLLAAPGCRAGRRWPTGLLLVSALAVGFARDQSALYRPPHHISRALGREPVLTRLAGTVVTTPVERPAVKRNLFLPFDPPPQTQFVLAADELLSRVPAVRTTGNVRVSIAAVGLNLRLGQRVRLAGELYRARGPQNPGAPDWELRDRRQGIDASLSVESAAHVDQPTGAVPWGYRVVARARGTARSLLFEPQAKIEADESLRLLDTMVLGQRRAADQKLNEAFLRAGGMHFLAVSGFNVAILALAAWWLVRRGLRLGRRAAAILTLLLSVAYALVAEPNAPILRATVGIVLAVLASLTNRPACPINWLALAAGCILLWNPNELFGAGFQLSFVQVLALMTVVPRLDRALFRRGSTAPPAEALTLPAIVRHTSWRWLVELAVAGGCAWVVALPLTLWHFHQWTPWGSLGSILLTPPVTLLTLFSLATMASNAIFPPLGALLGVALHGAADGLLRVVALFEYLPGTVMECHPPPMWLVLASYVVPAVLFVWRGGPGAVREHPRDSAAGSPLVRGKTLVAATSLTLLGLSWVGWIVLPARGPRPDYELHVFAVGSGGCALLTTPERQAIVLDVGTDGNFDAGETVVRGLRMLGSPRVAAILVSHENFDHFSGLPTLLRRWPVERWLTNPQFERGAGAKQAHRLLALLPPGAPVRESLHAGDQLALGAAQLDVLWPPEGLPDSVKINDTSLVVRVTLAGQRILLTGDVERKAMVALLDAARAGQVDLRADVLLAPHHGQVIETSSVTADLVAAVAPRVVVVSTRARRPKLAALLADAHPGVQLLETGQVGAVVLRMTTDGELRVETPYASP